MSRTIVKSFLLWLAYLGSWNELSIVFLDNSVSLSGWFHIWIKWVLFLRLGCKGGLFLDDRDIYKNLFQKNNKNCISKFVKCSFYS